MIEPVLIWLPASVLIVALVVEALARRDRRLAIDDEPSRSPPLDLARPSFVDHTPPWMMRYAQVYGPEQLSTFEHVVGMDALKRELVDLVGPVLGERANGSSQPSPAVLLWGARGSGKAVLVRAAAGHFGACLVHVSARCLVPRDAGTLQPQVAMLVRYAQSHTPSVLFIDDLEMLTTDAGRQGHVACHDLLNEVRRRDRRARSVVIAALTTPDDLIPSAALTGVLNRVIHVDRPDAATRAALLERLLVRHRMLVDDPDAIVAMTGGMTRSDLIRLIHYACGFAEIEHGPAAVVDPSHFKAAAREPTAPLVAQLALSRDLKVDIERLVAALADPNARVGAVLAGDSGTGKTTIARALAATTQRHLVTLTADDGRADVVEAKVAQALARRPSLLLIDESPLLESPARRAVEAGCLPGPHGGRIVAALDRALSRPGVSVIATATRFDAIDAQLRRPGRLEHQIWVPYPDNSARLELLRQQLRAVRVRGLSLATLADELRGLTPTQIGLVLDDAIRSAECRMVPVDPGMWLDDPVVTPSDLWRALQLVAAAA